MLPEQAFVFLSAWHNFSR